MKRWMVRAKYSDKLANRFFKRRGFVDGQLLYISHEFFTDKEHGTLFVKEGAAKGALTKTKNWSKASGVTLPVDIDSAEVIEITIVIPGD